MLPGRLHEGRGDAAPREMVATGSGLRSQPGQNPAYRPAPPTHFSSIGRPNRREARYARVVRARIVGIFVAVGLLGCSCSSGDVNSSFVRLSRPMPEISVTTLD